MLPFIGIAIGVIVTSIATSWLNQLILLFYPLMFVMPFVSLPIIACGAILGEKIGRSIAKMPPRQRNWKDGLAVIIGMLVLGWPVALFILPILSSFGPRSANEIYIQVLLYSLGMVSKVVGAYVGLLVFDNMQHVKGTLKR
jgi:hypothetical protein